MAVDLDMQTFISANAMAIRLADKIEALLCAAIKERGAASMAVSGGSTPAALYKELSARDLAWGQVTVVLVDERWVAPGEDGSNETFVRETLAQNKASKLKLIGLWSEARAPEDGLAEAEARLANLDAPFDVVIMGMGNDGHTASWFPHSDGLQLALAPYGNKLVAIKAIPSDVTGSHVQRITLTLSAIKDAGFICLLLAGEEKRKTLELALADGPLQSMPVRAILKARPNIYVAWAP